MSPYGSDTCSIGLDILMYGLTAFCVRLLIMVFPTTRHCLQWVFQRASILLLRDDTLVSTAVHPSQKMLRNRGSLGNLGPPDHSGGITTLLKGRTLTYWSLCGAFNVVQGRIIKRTAVHIVSGSIV